MSTQTIERWNGMTVRLSGIPLPKLSRALAATAQEALIDAVRYWHQRYARLHFTVYAYSRYGGREKWVYEPRRDRHGNLRRPLYRTGNLRRAFLGNIRIAATGAGVRMKARATWTGLPRYTYYDKTRSGEPTHKKYAELTITNRQEERDMADYFARRFQALLDAKEE